jgi:hypothetical protein
VQDENSADIEDEGIERQWPWRHIHRRTLPDPDANVFRAASNRISYAAVLNRSTISRQQAGRSSGLRLVTSFASRSRMAQFRYCGVRKHGRAAEYW